MNPNPPQAGLKHFLPGNKTPRASAAKMRALSKSRLVSPECVDYFVSVMRDPSEPTMCRLKAADSILRVAFPTKSVHVDAAALAPAERYLQVIFVKPGEQPQTNGHLIEAPANSFAVSFDGD